MLGCTIGTVSSFRQKPEGVQYASCGGSQKD